MSIIHNVQFCLGNVTNGNAKNVNKLHALAILQCAFNVHCMHSKGVASRRILVLEYFSQNGVCRVMHSRIGLHFTLALFSSG